MGDTSGVSPKNVADIHFRDDFSVYIRDLSSFVDDG